MSADSPFQNYRSSQDLTSFILKIGPSPDVKAAFMFDIIRSLAKHSVSDPKPCHGEKHIHANMHTIYPYYLSR
jgi:hypothetical protein